MFSDHTVAKFVWFVCQNMWEKSTSQLKGWEDPDYQVTRFASDGEKEEYFLFKVRQ